MNITSLVLALFLAAANAPQSHIGTLARELLDNFNAGRFDLAAKDFNTTLRGKVTPALLDEIKKELNAEAGQFKSVEDVQERRANGERVITMMLRYDKSLVEFRASFDAFDGVSAVYFTQIKAEPELEKASRELFAAFLANDFVATAKDFSPTLRAQLTRERLAELRANTAATYGAYKSTEQATERIWKGYRIIDLATEWEKNSIIASVTFDAQGKVAGLRLAPRASTR